MDLLNIGAIAQTIAQQRAALDALEAAIAGYVGAFQADPVLAISPAPAPARQPGKAQPTKTRRAPLAPWSVPDRLVGLCQAGPLAPRDLIRQAKAPKHVVVRALKQLLTDRRLMRLGRANATRYALAGAARVASQQKPSQPVPAVAPNRLNGTPSAQLLDLLRDGQPHRTVEVRRVLGLSLHRFVKLIDSLAGQVTTTGSTNNRAVQLHAPTRLKPSASSAQELESIWDGKGPLPDARAAS